MRFAHCASTFFSGPLVIILYYDHFNSYHISCPGSVMVEWQTLDASLWVRIPLKLNLKEIFESEIHIKESLKMMKLKMYV